LIRLHESFDLLFKAPLAIIIHEIPFFVIIFLINPRFIVWISQVSLHGDQLFSELCLLRIELLEIFSTP
jgi:hypothetical protein